MNFSFSGRPLRERWLRLSLCGVAIVLGAPAAARADEAPGDLKAGFFLLHSVSHDESQVHLIALIKTTPADVTDYVGRVSKEAEATLQAIDEMEGRNGALKLETNPLPPFEQKVRAGIAADKQHNLLFGTKGVAFARALLLTQIEATNYLWQITQVLADEDPSARDTHELLKISGHWMKLRDEGIRLLAER